MLPRASHPLALAAVAAVLAPACGRSGAGASADDPVRQAVAGYCFELQGLLEREADGLARGELEKFPAGLDFGPSLASWFSLCARVHRGGSALTVEFDARAQEVQGSTALRFGVRPSDEEARRLQAALRRMAETVRLVNTSPWIDGR